jgi:hypothetical protein
VAKARLWAAAPLMMMMMNVMKMEGMVAISRSETSAGVRYLLLLSQPFEDFSEPHERNK